jgi:hypothetical protein
LRRNWREAVAMEGSEIPPENLPKKLQHVERRVFFWRACSEIAGIWEMKAEM